MSPIIVIVLLLIGLLGAFFLMTELGTAQAATGGATQGLLATYAPLGIKILMVIMVLFTVYYIVDVIKTSARERKAAERKAKALEARERPYKPL